MSEIDSPAGAGSREPNLSVGTDGRVYLSWLEPIQPKGYALKFAVRSIQGRQLVLTAYDYPTRELAFLLLHSPALHVPHPCHRLPSGFVKIRHFGFLSNRNRKATVQHCRELLPQATIGNVNGGISLVRFTSGAVVFSGFNWILGPSHPGDTLVLWGTGGGADPANDTGGTSGDQTAAGNFIVIVGGRRITPIYAGASSGYPGL